MSDRTAQNLHAGDWFTITGKGRVAVVDTRQIEGDPINVGDVVKIDGDLYVLLGIEAQRGLSSPPVVKPHMGFVVRQIRQVDRDHWGCQRNPVGLDCTCLDGVGLCYADPPTETPDALLARARALLDGVTEGPWKWERNTLAGGQGGYDEVISPGPVDCMSYCYGGTSTIDEDNPERDREFIAQSRTLVPELVDLAARQAAEIDRLRTELDTANTKAAHP